MSIIESKTNALDHVSVRDRYNHHHAEGIDSTDLAAPITSPTKSTRDVQAHTCRHWDEGIQ
jgi:hypothetical protein